MYIYIIYKNLRAVIILYNQKNYSQATVILRLIQAKFVINLIMKMCTCINIYITVSHKGTMYKIILSNTILCRPPQNDIGSYEALEAKRCCRKGFF